MTGKIGEQSHHGFGGYRCYITPEAYVITYRDQDFVRVLRDVQHTPGFILLLVKLVFGALIGRRTALRDKFALYHTQHDADAHELNLKLLAAPSHVIEFDVQMIRDKA